MGFFPDVGSSHSLIRSRGVPRFGWLVVLACRRNRHVQGVHTRTADRRKGRFGRDPRHSPPMGPSLHTKGPPLVLSPCPSTRDVFAASSSSDKTHRWTHSGHRGRAWLGTLRVEPALERVHQRAAGATRYSARMRSSPPQRPGLIRRLRCPHCPCRAYAPVQRS